MKFLLCVLILCVVMLFALGQYVSAHEPKPRLIVFSAKWCGACKDAAPFVDEIEAKGYKVIRYDADEDKDALREYKIKSLPTFIVYKGYEKVLRTSYIEAVRAYFD